MKPIKMALPKTLDGAVSSCEDKFEKSKLLAGGTDLLAELKERTQTPDMLVNLKTIPGLTEIRRSDRGLEIGALVTLSDLAANAEVARGWPALVAAIDRAATPNVRNVGTIGGNLCQRPRCWYYRDEAYHCLKKGGSMCYAVNGENEFHSIYDNAVCCAVHPSNTAPVLMAHGASVDIVGPRGQRTVALEEFFVTPSQDVTRENILDPNEIVTGVVLPRGSENRHCAYVETREKQSFDWATCGSTANLEIGSDGKVRKARIVLSAVAPTPVRRKDLEKMLVGRKVDDAVIAGVCKAAAIGAVPLAQNGFKVALVKVTLKRAIQQAMKG